MFKLSPKSFGFILSLSLLDGCGGTLGGNPEVDGTDPSLQKGLSFAIMDAPVADAKNVFLTVESLALLKSDGGWLTIPLETKTEIDLLHYQNGLTAPLASIAQIAPGTYAQTRLVLSDSSPARLVDLSGVEHVLKVPSGSESGLKINSPITIEAGLAKAMVIDFDLRKSIKLTGNWNNPNAKYILKPVLRMVDRQEAGSIQGPMAVGDVVCLYAAGAVKDSSDDCENSVASGSISNSNVHISFLAIGVYDLRIFKDGQVLKDITGIKIEANTVTKTNDL